MADDLIERLRMEAQIHAQEARTANATIAEIYQLCSGGKGEPGNWHGAEPVRALVAERDALAATLRQQAGRVDGLTLPACLKDAEWVHAGMLRGDVAVPSIRNMVHLRGPVYNTEDGQLARIAELQEQVETLTRALSGEKAGPVGDGKYRLLGQGDVIEPDDEFIADNAVDWVPVKSNQGAANLFVGMQYRLGTLKQARRRLPASPTPGKEG